MKAYPRFGPLLRVVAVATALAGPGLVAQEQVPVVQAIPAQSTVTETGAAVAPVTLEQLVAPIALYPDALIAIILPASTASSDVVVAARFLNVGGNANQIDTQPWDDSVKSLAHYPDVVKWMDENLVWTQNLGQAYIEDPQGVMDAIQKARARARANGVLVDTPQQQVVVEDSYIRIIPAQPDVIYVPRYDPEIIYVEQPIYYSSDPWLTFGIGFGVGSWLAYDCDWGHRSIWVDYRRHEHWRENRDWRFRSYPGRPGIVARHDSWRHWSPNPSRPRPPHRDTGTWSRNFVQPTPLAGAPRFDGDRYRSNNNHVVGGDRPGVRSAPQANRERQRSVDSSRERDRNVDAQTRAIRPAPSVIRNPSGANFSQRNGGTAASSPAVTSVNPPGAPRSPTSVNQPTTVTSPTGVVSDPRRGGGNRPDRRAGIQSVPAQPGSAGTVSVVPSERRWQNGNSGTTRTAPTGERRREATERDSDRRIRPAMPTVRSSPPPSAPVAATQAPVVRPAPQVREYRQPSPSPAPAASSAPAIQPARQPQVDRGSSGPAMAARGGDQGSRGGGESRGSRGDRRQEH